MWEPPSTTHAATMRGGVKPVVSIVRFETGRKVKGDSQDLVRTGLWLRAGRRLLQPADDASPRQRVLRVGKFYAELGFQRSWGTPDTVPGRVFKGKVRLVLDAIAAGPATDGRPLGCRHPSLVGFSTTVQIG
jgi:hypothetical protein